MKFEMEKVFATMSVISFRNYFQLILYSTKYLILDVLKLTRKRTTRYWCSVFVHKYAIYFVLNSFQKTVILIFRINAGCYCSFYQVKNQKSGILPCMCCGSVLRTCYMYMYRPYVYFKVRFCNCRLNLFINYTSSSCYFQFHEIVFVVF